MKQIDTLEFTFGMNKIKNNSNDNDSSNVVLSFRYLF